MSGTALVFIGTDAVERVLTWEALVAALREA